MDKHERVGILLVHGIGETKKFENIEGVATEIATVLRANRALEVRVILNTSDNAQFAAGQQVWLADGSNEPVIIEVKEQVHDAIKITELCFTEAWWADIGKSDTLGSQLSFWQWGLSLWSREQYLGKKDPNNWDAGEREEDIGVLSHVHLPTNVSGHTPRITLFDRLRFFVVSWVVLLILPLLSFLSVILRQVLALSLRPDILVQYLGDIKHYQDAKRTGAGYLIDIGQPSRISIRRRVVKALVKMRLANYDRWYVLAHSLGTVVAFNGLMEPSAALANYLNRDLWNRYKEECRDPDSEDSHYKAPEPLTEKQADGMFPSRPAWLGLDDIISRKTLFKNLRGFMTYGPPLSKFAVVWPALVPINNDNSIFSPDFEWINVYDPTDPVADKTKYFDLMNCEGKPVVEIPYKAESIHLLSHVEYLNYNPNRVNPLVKQVAYWLLRGGKFEVPRTGWGWPDEDRIRIYQYIRYFIWLISGLAISEILGFFVSRKLPDFISWLSLNVLDLFFFEEPLDRVGEMLDLSLFSNPFLYLFGSAILVFWFGVMARALDRWRPSRSRSGR